jgi:hypothetical protein
LSGQNKDIEKAEIIEQKYSQLYEDSVNPFVLFNRKVRKHTKRKNKQKTTNKFILILFYNNYLLGEISTRERIKRG